MAFIQHTPQAISQVKRTAFEAFLVTGEGRVWELAGCSFPTKTASSTKLSGQVKLVLCALLLFIASSNALHAQKQDRDLLRAEKLYRMEQYDAAIAHYEKALQREYDAGVSARLGDCFRRRGEYIQAEHWYGQAVMADALAPEYFRQYAQVLRANGKSEQSLEWFERYDRYAGNKGKHLPGFQLERDQESLASQYRVALLGINTAYSEIAPALYDQQLIFASDRPGTGSRGRSSRTGSPYYDLFISPLSERGVPGKASRIRGPINSAWNDAGFSYDAISGEIWFTRTSSNGGKRIRDGQGIVHSTLYTATWKGDRLSRIKRFRELPRNISAVHPSLTPDGSRLYFAAQLPGGYGGFDIWYMHRLDRGDGWEWSEPINAGYGINTAGNELFPFAAGSRRLYFSSDGHPGLGGLDIYRVDFSANSWELPQHLPAPINSPRDDFGLIVFNNQGFFSSNRIGGMGADDLYAFERVNVRVDVYVVNAQSGQPIAGANVELITDGQSNQQKVTDARGMAWFEIPPGLPYYIAINKSGFHPELFTETGNNEQYNIALYVPESTSPTQESGKAPDHQPQSPAAMPSGPDKASQSPQSQEQTIPTGKSEKGDRRAEPSSLPVSTTDEPMHSAEETAFRIRIGIYRKPNLEELDKLNIIAPLFFEERSNNTRAYFIGPFSDAGQASQALVRVKSMKYTDAFVEEYPR